MSTQTFVWEWTAEERRDRPDYERYRNGVWPSIVQNNLQQLVFLTTITSQTGLCNWHMLWNYATKLEPSASASTPVVVWMGAWLNNTVNDIVSQRTHQGSRSCPSKVGHTWQTRLKVSSSVGHVKDVLHGGVQIASTSLLPFERKKTCFWKHK